MTAFGTRSSEVTFAQAMTGSRMAQDQFLRENQLLVRKIVARYIQAQALHEDLFQEGCLGLLKALSKFDPTRGLKFSTYAVPWIRVYVERYIKDNLTIVSMPMRTQELVYRIRAMACSKSPQAIADELNISREAVEAMLHINHQSDGLELVKGTSNPEDSAFYESAIDRINLAYDELSSQQKDIVMLALDIHPEYDSVSAYARDKDLNRAHVNKLSRSSLGLLQVACKISFQGEVP